ncbi:hypothetical protein [Bernardetia sp. MNP-M8]|uniref:hypothetical protein n=1 Tax=Bernardetia sp. MNP-M8 TaxID=3127470 RepID=UPI0030D2B4FF
MNIYCKFVLLLVFSIIFFSCEKQDIEEELTTYERGVLAIVNSTYNNEDNASGSSDIAHFAEDGTITYDLFRKANNGDSLKHISSIYEGVNSIYLLDSRKVIEVDKFTFEQKNIFTILDDYGIANYIDIKDFTYIKKNETAILITRDDRVLWVSLSNRQILKDLTDKQYSETIFNSDKNELLALVTGRSLYIPYTIEHLNSSTLNTVSEVGNTRNTSIIKASETAPIRNYKLDGYQNLWTQVKEVNYITLSYYYVEVIVRYDDASSKVLDNYLPERRLYQLKRNNEKSVNVYNISRVSNSFYYLEGLRKLKKIEIADINNNVYAIKTQLSDLTGNEPALEELATSFVELPIHTQIRRIHINEKNGDVILSTHENNIGNNLQEYLEHLQIYDKQGNLKKSYTLEEESKKSTRKLELTGYYSLYSNYIIIRE